MHLYEALGHWLLFTNTRASGGSAWCNARMIAAFSAVRLGFFLSKSSFRIMLKGNRNMHEPLAYDFEQIGR
jgi:hypothetical protein